MTELTQAFLRVVPTATFLNGIARWCTQVGVTIAIVIFSAVTIDARADTTVCQGTDNCTVVESSGPRRMSREETISHQRSQQRSRINGVDCEWASNPDLCRRIRNALLETF